MPSWMTRRPFLFAAYLGLINRFERWPAMWLVPVALVVTAGWLVTRPEAADALIATADHPLMSFVFAAIHASISVSRRKQRICAEIESSWLSPLPFQISAPMRLAFAPIVQTLAAAIILAAVVATGRTTGDATTAAAHAPNWVEAVSVLLSLVIGLTAGGALGWFLMPRFKTPVVGSKYAIVRQPRARWATAPRLEPLSYWAVAQTRVLNNPRVTANTMVIVLLSIPMGTPGEVAIAAAAGWMVALHIVFTLSALMRTAFAAGWWLRPTPIQRSRFALVMSWRAVVSLAVTGGVVTLVAAAVLNNKGFR